MFEGQSQLPNYTILHCLIHLTDVVFICSVPVGAEQIFQQWINTILQSQNENP